MIRSKLIKFSITKQNFCFVKPTLILISFCSLMSYHVSAQSHEQAVQLARNGNHQEALDILDSLYLLQGEQLLLNDIIVINAWAKRHKTSVEWFDKKPISVYPPYVLKSILVSAKEAGMTDLGLAVVTQGMKAYPEEQHIWLMRKAQFLLYKGLTEEANRILKLLDENSIEKMELTVRVHINQGELTEALLILEKLLIMEPSNAFGLFQKKEVLEKLRLGRPLQDLDSESKKALYIQATAYLRWSENATETTRERKALANKSLVILDDLLAEEKNEAVRSQYSYDRLNGLKNAGKCSIVMSEYETLKLEKTLPIHTKLTIASCALELKQPQLSMQLYEEVMEENQMITPPLDYFYALSDAGQSKKALEWIQQLQSETGSWVRYNKSNVTIPNAIKLDLDLLEVSAYQYQNKLSEAWKLISEIEDKAGMNSYVIEQKAATSQARGWNRNSLMHFQRAAALNNESIGAQEGMANNYLILNQAQETSDILDSLQKLLPEESATIRLSNEWKRFNMWESWTNVVYSNSKGPVQDGQGFRTTIEAYSIPFKHKFRWMGTVLYDYTEIPEGAVNYTKGAIGLEYKHKSWELFGQFHGNFTTFNQMGGKLSAAWKPDDFNTFNLEMERFSSESPQRGFYYGVRADHLSANYAYRRNENTSLHLGFQHMRFTDGNLRYAESIAINQNIYHDSNIEIAGSFAFYTSKNSESDVTYFNPEQDYSLSPTLNIGHIILQNYEFSYFHSFNASCSYYDQKNFESNWNYNFRYQQSISFSYLSSLAWSISGGRQVYDGDQEPTYIFELLYYVKF